ncbi:MAG: hypothetical protein WBV72_02640 [Nitrososphaeraceae archaeon]
MNKKGSVRTVVRILVMTAIPMSFVQNIKWNTIKSKSGNNKL